MSTWKLFRPLDITNGDLLSLGAGAVSELLSSSLLRQTSGSRTLSFIGDGFRLLDGKLLPFGKIDGIELFDGVDEVLKVLDTGWSLLKVLSHYNPLSDRWDIDGLLDYLFEAVDRFEGSDGDDSFAGRGGDDTVIGGGGIDLAAYAGARAGFTLAPGATGWQLTDRQGNEGRDTLVGVERLQFADGALALDLAGHAGTVARLLGALFGPDAVRRPDWAGQGLALLDQGMSAAQVAELAVATPQFAALAGSHGHADFVRWVYHNVTGGTPAQTELDHYTALLDSGSHTQGALALLASQTAELAARIDLIGLADTGLAFLPAP